MKILFGIILLALFMYILFWIFTFVGDVFTMRYIWKNDWKDSFILGWLYFKDNFNNRSIFKV